MSGDEISLILARIDRLERKIDDLAVRYERHEAQAEQRDVNQGELRRFLYGVAGGVLVAALTGVGGLLVTLLRLVD